LRIVATRLTSAGVSSPQKRQEVYEEGLRIPIMKLFIEGEPNHELLKLVRANVRTPDETVGDLYAQTASNAVGARSLLQMMR
jgi:N-methylhydantoinase B/oxoprolinase/acetone carboxylase alpha subunit